MVIGGAFSVYRRQADFRRNQPSKSGTINRSYLINKNLNGVYEMSFINSERIEEGGNKMSKTTGFMLYLIATAVFAGALVLPICGQLPLSEGPTKERAQNDADRDLEERVAYQRMLATIAEKQRKKRDPKLALAELQEDFKSIQAANLEMVRALSKGGNLDFKFAADSASEIKKRAARLKTNLALPAPEKEVKPPAPAGDLNLDQLKRSMLNLGKLVYGFVKSPFFKELDVVNTEEAVKVRDMLDEIMELSENIKKSSENLNKTTRKSN
jgi:hypothetical protein